MTGLGWQGGMRINTGEPVLPMWSKNRSCLAGACRPWVEAKPRADPVQIPRSCEEQESYPAQFCQIHLTTRSSKCPKGVPLPFSDHFNSNMQLLQFFLFTALFITIILSGPHVQFGLVHTKAEVSTWKRSPSVAEEDGSMKKHSRAHGNDKVLDLQQQFWLHSLTCSASNSLSYLKKQINPFLPVGQQLQVAMDSRSWFLTSPWYPRHL